jgi:hypothetical protein
MWTSIFNVRTYGGMFGTSSEFKNSVGFCSKCNTSVFQNLWKQKTSCKLISCTEIKKKRWKLFLEGMIDALGS